MKQLFISACVLLLFSCKKDRTCSCTESITVENPSGTHTDVQNFDIVIHKARKRPSKYYCSHLRITDINNNNVSTQVDLNCSLK